MPPQITCASALPDKTAKHESCILHSLLYQCIARIQAVAALFLQSFWLTTHTHAVVWLPKSSKSSFSLGLLWGHVQEKGSREHRCSWTVLHAVHCFLGFLFPKVMLKH